MLKKGRLVNEFQLPKYLMGRHKMYIDYSTQKHVCLKNLNVVQMTLINSLNWRHLTCIEYPSADSVYECYNKPVLNDNLWTELINTVILEIHTIQGHFQIVLYAKHNASVNGWK